LTVHLNFAGVGDLWEGSQDLASAFAGTPSPDEVRYCALNIPISPMTPVTQNALY
jgi:hypothetical protein